MPTATLKCRCGCKRRERRELMLIVGTAAFVDDAHKREYGRKKPNLLRAAAIKGRAAKKPKKKLKSIARLRNDVAELLQKLVRMKAADPVTGMCRCSLCGEPGHWKEMQGGHFIERGKGATKLLEENVHPQHAGCNLFGMKKASGVLAYRRYMVDMYGETTVRELERLASTTVKHTRHELEGLAFDFKRQIQQQEARLSGREVPQQSEPRSKVA